ncbi:MAG: phosphate ABC transporter permease subunit PstC [Burkholderiales bacterium]
MSTPASTFSSASDSRAASSGSPAVTDAASLAKRVARFAFQDRWFERITGSFAALVLLSMFGIIGSLVYESAPVFSKFGVGFIASSTWNPSGDVFGAGIAVYGTLVTSAIAMVVAVPISFGIALFLTETCPLWLRRPLGTAIELLAGVPSIIYGIWGLFVLAPLLQQYVQPLLIKTGLPLFAGPPLGVGIFTAGVVLALMVIPFTASVMRDVFDTVPPILKESAYGIGCTTWEVVRNIVLPYTRVGVIGGVMLGLGRALGETMAVTFVIGNANRLSSSLFAPGNSIASTLANEFAEADPVLHVPALFALGLILFAITFVVLALSKWLVARATSRAGI